MNFSCDQCQRRYSLPDDRLVSKTVKVRCKNCQFMMTVGPLESMAAAPRGGAPASPAPWDEEPTRARPASDPSAQWFAMVQGKQAGPLSGGELSARVRSGEITLRTYVWKNGMGDWKRAAEVAELAVVLSTAKAEQPPKSAPRAVPAPTPAPVRSRNHAASRPVDEDDERTLVAEPGESVASLRAAAAAAAVTPRSSPARSTGPGTATGARAPHPSKVDLGTLFSDVDLDEGERQSHGPGKATNRSSKASSPEEDPFASLGALDPDELPPVGEATSFFIAQAGMHKRNPPWKIGLFVAGGIAFPVLLYLVLSSLNVVPAEIHHVDASGNPVASKVFSSDGISALGRMLLGGQKAKPTVALSRRRTVTAGVALPKDRPLGEMTDGPRGGSAGTALLDTNSVTLAKGKRAPQVDRDLEKIYGDSSKRDVGPGLNRLAQRDAEPARDSSGGPPAETISKVVGQNQLAFQFCIEQQLKKNPHFKGGKISLIATVASSGIVKKTQIDRHDIDVSDLGDCLKVKAKRMTFPPFSGDEVDLEIPLILTTAM